MIFRQWMWRKYVARTKAGKVLLFDYMRLPILAYASHFAVFSAIPPRLTSLDRPLLSSKMSSIFRRRRCVSAKALSQWPRAVLI